MILQKYYIFVSIVLFVLLTAVNAGSFKDVTGLVTLETTVLDDGLAIKLTRAGTVENKLIGTIGTGLDFHDCSETTTECTFDDGATHLTIEAIEDGFTITFESSNLDKQFEDNFDLSIGKLNWYGGPERWSAKWPIEKLTISGNDPYVLKRSDNFAVAEAYWLNSVGGYITVDRKTPLFIDQNEKKAGFISFEAKLQSPYINRKRLLLRYNITALDDPKAAHLHAVKNYLNKPTDHPAERMIRLPIWTTWAKFKKDINDQTVIDFARDIVDHGFQGQLEIDDDWETCYGNQVFKSDKFSDISNTVKTLKDLNFTVTLWVHPFVNDECDNSQVGKEKGYFVKNGDGSDATDWWDGGNAHIIDFTNSEARDWFVSRLKGLQENPGIDSFKFDAGETNYGPESAVYNETIDVELYPNVFSEHYVRTCAELGKLIEVRSASNTQDLPIFVRMLDKDSNWGDDNGLYTLVTTLLQMNMNGYSMVLPDMIGGNGYNHLPSAELLARWTQANTFMPTMQFSYLPWDITSEDFDGLAIIKKFVDLHSQYADNILKAMDATIENGTPVNPPIWWISPTDTDALAVDDEYLLGENILVAPVIEEGKTSRNIYLPNGVWKDGTTGDTYQGPIKLEDYPAPIDVLPHFILQKE